MMLSPVITPQARKDLRALPPADRRRVLERLEAYAAASQAAGHDVAAIRGARGHFRLRCGDWRAIFSVVGES